MECILFVKISVIFQLQNIYLWHFFCIEISQAHTYTHKFLQVFRYIPVIINPLKEVGVQFLASLCIHLMVL